MSSFRSSSYGKKIRINVEGCTFRNRNIKDGIKTLIINRDPFWGPIKILFIKQKQTTQRFTTLCKENTRMLKRHPNRAWVSKVTYTCWNFCLFLHKTYYYPARVIAGD